ncbi:MULTISPECIES: DUF6415 family natural product biosynthesis protein [unclassified Streptomyces]|uniref:DUF6415 family natural product biosynthesis protein n=1 Tax=unclassified Streptomyces TaxID=2593676 RepID=UPI0036F0F233
MTDPTPIRPSEPTKTADVPHVADLPLDIETAGQAADDALRIRLGTVTRREIDAWTAELRGRVSLFAEEVINLVQTPATRAAQWEVDQLLASAPGDDTLVFNAYQHLRDLARMLRWLVTEHHKRTETADSDEQGRARPSLVGSAAEPKAMPTDDGMGT